MATTNYYSIGGEIIGEETGGVRRDYLTDALGSVTATVTSAGAIENTYRYKPYGAQLSKTGTAADPAFTWVGKWGYRSSTLSYSEKYIRSRYFSINCGFWNSRDKINIAFRNRYTYNSPANYVDYSGYIEVKPVNRDKWILKSAVMQPNGRFCQGSACGSYDAYWTFTLDKDSIDDIN